MLLARLSPFIAMTLRSRISELMVVLVCVARPPPSVHHCLSRCCCGIGGRGSVTVAVASSAPCSSGSPASAGTPVKGTRDLIPVSPSALLGSGGADLLESRQVASMGAMDELHSDDGEDDPSQPFSKQIMLVVSLTCRCGLTPYEGRCVVEGLHGILPLRACPCLVHA